MKQNRNRLMRMNRQGGRLAAMLLAGAAGLVPGACVQVTAPTDPITINLNINIRQEVVYRLDSQARELIEQNTEIF